MSAVEPPRKRRRLASRAQSHLNVKSSAQEKASEKRSGTSADVSVACDGHLHTAASKRKSTNDSLRPTKVRRTDSVHAPHVRVLQSVQIPAHVDRSRGPARLPEKLVVDSSRTESGYARDYDSTIDAGVQSDSDEELVPAWEVDDHLRRKIKSKLTGKESGTGMVYIFRDRNPGRSHLLKIGMTSKEVTERKRQIESVHNIKLRRVHSSRPFRNYLRAEQLAQLDLANLYRPFECSKPGCSVHKEWFEVSEDLAIRTVDRWVSFLRQNPYDQDRNLKTSWRNRLDAMDRPSSDEDPLDHDRRWKRWEFVLEHRSLLDRWTDTVAPTVEHWKPFLRNYFWQTSSVLPWLLLFMKHQKSSYAKITILYLALFLRSMYSHFQRERARAGRG